MRCLTAGLALAGVAMAQGVSWPEAKLQAMRENLARHGTSALLILRDGRKVFEWYAPDAGPAKPHFTASMAKALVGGVSLMLAMSDGRIRPGDRAARYIPGWSEDPLRSKILIRHLATHSSGVSDASQTGSDWMLRFWKRTPDPFTIAMREAPVLFEPGTHYQYSNPGMAALSYAITASLRGAPQPDVKTLLRERVMRPLGIPDEEWSIGYGRAYQVDGLDLYANWGGGAYTARATAKVLEWMMNRGKPLTEARWVDAALRYAGMAMPDRSATPYAPGSGLGWWVNFDGVWPAVPRDAFAGAGAGNQVALAVPSLKLIVVRNGAALAAGESEFWKSIYEMLFQPVMEAMGNPVKPAPPPYPASTVIRSVEFAPADSVVRKAKDSDNWPITWADDDNLYTAYGDGHGFEPFVSEKLSLGFARVSGGPDDFASLNVRSPTGERTGDGARGAKASGLLMVDGILYMWVRNVGNSQLAWSSDHGRTWTWGFRLERSFGSPAFLNFGRNYAGARDGYVYTYSQDGASAYEVDDGVVLARAPKSELRERAAWEFFAGFGGDGKPSFTREIDRRRPVFAFPGHCQRVDAVYDAGLQRHLLAVGYGHNGGWGLYEAPTPWGPWAVAFHTEYWGLGETHGYRLPSKWISPDGRSLAMVFSGLIFNGITYDAFCVRKMKLLE
jgi:CubicO group peptidase (beta-lactamase class C family)